MKPTLLLLCTLLLIPSRGQAQSSGIFTNRLLMPKSSAKSPALRFEQKPAADPRDLKELGGKDDRFMPPAKVAIPSVQIESRPFTNALDFPPAAVEKSSQTVAQARQFQTRGDFTNAVKALEAAKTEAWRSNDRETAGLAALNTARTLQAGMAVQAIDSSQRPLVVANYQTAISNAPPRQQALALNNLATLYLKERRPADAARLLRQIDWSSVDPTEEHLCRYNLARAEELSGNRVAAFEQYRLAISKQPHYEPAINGAFRLLVASSNVTNIAQLAEELADRKEAARAARHLRTGLEKFSTTTNADRMIVALARCYVALRTTPPDYQLTEKPFLNLIAERSPDIAPMLRQMHSAFAVDFPATFSPDEYRNAFPAWLTASNTFSALLNTVGNFHSHADPESSGTNSHRKALACYIAAWMFDLSNTEAALYATALLHEKRATLDPQGQRMTEITRRLFEMKGSAYALPIKTHQDWLNLLPLHLLLATVYERMERWGSENNVESAIFQLYRAVQIEELLLREDPTFVSSPNVSQRLARAYKNVNRRENAWQQYVKAAEGFVYHQQVAEAKKCLAEASLLQVALDGASRDRWKIVQDKCDSMSPGYAR